MSGETKFTPGPWAKVKSSTLYIAPASDINRVIARMQCKRPAMFAEAVEADANARLIAAAPEMYALLERILDEVQWDELAVRDRAGTYVAVCRTLAAARGEEA